MKNKTLNLLILNFIIATGIWGTYFYLIYQVNTISSSFEDTKHKIIFSIKKREAIADLKNKVQADLKDGLDLKEFLIHPEQTADVVQTIEGFGSTTRTKITTQSVSTEEAIGLPEGVDYLKANFKIEGSKGGVLKSIALIENIPYNIKINKLNFSISNTSPTSTPKWSSSIDMVFVKLKDTEAILTQ